MLKDNYTFPSIFSYDDDGISVEFPNLPGCLTFGTTTEEAINKAKEAMALHISSIEDDHEEIPLPTDIKLITIEPKQVIVLIDVWMPVYRNNIKYASIKKTLTLPKWLNDVAEENNVNFSQLLQESIKEHLGLYSSRK
ncbi:MAG: pilus assembly protein HicB [Firmicutes bacterium HGW-Firmicutes-7]|nr:MAG: pilus assembly protein HicB [Firmicutes bacterium HGW-Firmicutes-7]